MKYYVDMVSLNEDGEELIQFAQNNIRPLYDKMLSFLNDCIWEGDAKDAFEVKYKEKLDKILKINEIVIKLGAFMVTCSKHYGESNDKIMKNWQDYLEELKKENIY